MEKAKGPRIRTIPGGDDKERLVCPECSFIHYENPKIVVGTVSTWEDQYLLVRRAVAPRIGYWSLPAGYLEMGESAREGAIRETYEESGAKVIIDGLLAQYDVRRIGQIQLIFRAQIVHLGELKAGNETLEVGLFAWQDIPWQELAFPTVSWALHHHFESRHRNSLVPFYNPTKLGEDPPPLSKERRARSQEPTAPF